MGISFKSRMGSLHLPDGGALPPFSTTYIEKEQQNEES